LDSDILAKPGFYPLLENMQINLFYNEPFRAFFAPFRLLSRTSWSNLFIRRVHPQNLIHLPGAGQANELDFMIFELPSALPGE
jgi:hypothetical protein